MSNISSHAGDIATVTVVGAGFLGRQIAAMVAASGREVRLNDAVPAAADGARDWLRGYLATPIAEGHLDWDLDAVVARIQPIHDLGDALAGADLMIEAVREDLATKREVFRAISTANPAIYLATNSSSLPSAALRDVVAQPHKLVNLHFFSEFWHRSMVELMGCGETSDETMRVLHRFGTSLGLYCAVVRGQSKGFIINRVWRAVKREALRVVDEGHADPEDVDRLWALFWGIDYGPFGMMDEVGLDVIADIEDSYIAVATDPTDRRSRTLHEHVAAGKLGVKTGQGFYTYPDPAFEAPGWPRETGGETGDD
jgi:3-hydroxybutyryl-CoA dehydrogenase